MTKVNKFSLNSNNDGSVSFKKKTVIESNHDMKSNKV